MNHVVAVFKNQGIAAGFKKLADVIEGAEEANFPEFYTLQNRLLDSPEGKAAYAVAKDFFDSWAEGDSPLQAAQKAIEKDGAALGKVLLQDVADWLGIIDRNPSAA